MFFLILSPMKQDNLSFFILPNLSERTSNQSKKNDPSSSTDSLEAVKIR